MQLLYQVISVILGYASFDPINEFLGDNHSKEELDEFLKVMPENRNIINRLPRYFATIAQVSQIINSILTKHLTCRRFFIVKNALSFHSRNPVLRLPYLGTSTVPCKVDTI